MATCLRHPFFFAFLGGFDNFASLYRYMKKISSLLSENDLLLVLSLLVGLACGLAAVLLKTGIELMQEGVEGLCSSRGLLMLVFPGIGMFLSMLFVHYIIRDNIGHGVTKVLVAVSKNESRIKAHNMWSSLLSSCVTIGLGG